ncbi:MAG: TraX family protein [Bacillota bacterium]
MSSFHLKMIAITTMLIDHIGAIIFPEFIIFRVIGRLAFPLFAFLITEGYRHTSNFNKYLIRLSVFALLSQYPFWLAFGFNLRLNIFFTLSFGLLAIYLSEKYENILPVIIFALFADIISTDYGAFGVLLIYFIHYFRNDYYKMIGFISLLYAGFYLVGGLMADTGGVYYYIQIFALISFIFVKLYNGSQGPKLKYFFYLFYPVHLLILGLLF